jgi:hypothetical protein
MGVAMFGTMRVDDTAAARIGVAAGDDDATATRIGVAAGDDDDDDDGG